jgi:AraC-like DNA-binding protein
MTMRPPLTTLRSAELEAPCPPENPPPPDVLSDVLRAIRLTGAVFFSVDATGSWAFEGPASSAVATFVHSGKEHVIPFHAIASGSCWVRVPGERPVQLHAGDVVMLPRNDRHTVSSEPGLSAGPVEVQLDPDSRTPLPLPVRLGARTGAQCEVICGFLGCEVGPFNPLLTALPRRMLVARGAARGGAVGRYIGLTREELLRSGPGREAVLARLAELMFVEAMRWLVEAAPGEMGWLAGMSDELVGRSLSELHARPGRAWTLDGLAREVGASRTVLAERFTALLAMGPMQYLARWRMQLAAELLATTGACIAEIADRLGYGSEAALSRAFKRIVGVSPAHWRQGRRSARGSTTSGEETSPEPVSGLLRQTGT